MVTYEPWRCGWVPREQPFGVDGQLALKVLQWREDNKTALTALQIMVNTLVPLDQLCHRS
jgi:hypothetical protein